jgi:hypothetical protein
MVRYVIGGEVMFGATGVGDGYWYRRAGRKVEVE